ncbi:encapsulin, partial [Streptomyces spiralis]
MRGSPRRWRPAESNNLHRDLAPITSAAWAQIEDEARRTFE